jgi:ribosomal protein S12 methylthiotransferase
VGRSYAETPEVDGLIVIHSDRELETGEYVSVKIIRADDYEITGTVIE